MICYKVRGLAGVLPWLAGMIIPFILCYLLFYCRMLGAGDVKLLSVIGSIVGVSQILRIILTAVCIGGVLSIIKMLRYRNARQRFLRLWHYIAVCRRERKFQPYYDLAEEGEEGVIPFTIAISLAAFWCL